jgi:hypothetical protein
MAACQPDLTNVNMLTPLGFKLSIDAQEFRYLEYFCIQASLPSVNTPAAGANFRNLLPRIPGETLAFDSLNVTFIVDEELKNYLEIYKWLYENTRTEDLKWRDMTLSILTNQNNTNKQIVFRSVIPISLTSIDFNVQSTEVEYLTCSVEFQYAEFEFVK